MTGIKRMTHLETGLEIYRVMGMALSLATLPLALTDHADQLKITTKLAIFTMFTSYSIWNNWNYMSIGYVCFPK